MARRWRAVLVALVAATSTAAGTTSVAAALARSTSTIAEAGVANSKSASCDAGGAPQVFAGWSEQIREFDFAYCHGFGPGASYSGDVYATMGPAVDANGDRALIGHLTPEKASSGTLLRNSVDVQYCSLPGGPDLPGAVFSYELVVNKPAHYEFRFQYTLPDDKSPPVLSGGSSPPHGTTVHPGEVISVHITASEPTNKGPQEGIRDIQLVGTPGGLIDSAQYGNHPTACDLSRLTKTFRATYTVPHNPPAVIRLTAVAHDFVNNESATLSADFPTADNVWTGKAHVVTHITYPPSDHQCPATEVDDYTFNLVVGTTGAVQGYDTKSARVTSCGPPSVYSLRFPVYGQLTGAAFRFSNLYFVTVVPVSSSKTMATAQFHGGSTDGPNGAWTGTINLTES